MEKMEVDGEGVEKTQPAQESENPATIDQKDDSNTTTESKGATIPMDKVSMLQESVDKTALGMFNALRLLPASIDEKSTPEEKEKAIKELANDVLRAVKETDKLIEDLPGLNRSESEQMDIVRQLQIQSEEEGQTLRQAEEEAQQWMDRARDSLRVISENRLRKGH